MMNRRRHGARVLIFHFVELGLLAGSLILAHRIRLWTQPWWGEQKAGPLSQSLWLLPAALGVGSALLWGFRTYAAFRSRGAFDHALRVGAVSLAGTVLLFALQAALKQHEFNRSIIALYGAVSGVVLLSFRLAALGLLGHYTEKGYDRLYVLVAGTGPEAEALAEGLEGVRGAVYQVRGFLSEDPSRKGAAEGRWKVLGTPEELPELAKRDPVDEVYLFPGSRRLEEFRPFLEACEAMGIVVHLRLTPFETLISRLAVSETAGASYLTFSTAPRSGIQLAMKRTMDLAGASLLLALLSPLLLLAALLVKLTSKGPAVFRQERVGMNGRVFTLFKFRTMVQGAELKRQELESKNEMDGPVFKIKADPRITWIGKLLRKTSIDELPQLWNVVKGDMSLVGPRPLPTYEVEKFESWQRRRMSMRPGITCLWQVSGRNRVTCFADWMRLDLQYVDSWSLGLDLKILLLTLPAVFGGRGAY
jgi:exopolysaccharide biosynthesis polyprenyl glycosylphosphotransferase